MLYIKELGMGKVKEYTVSLIKNNTIIDNITTGHLAYNTFYQTIGKEKVDDIKAASITIPNNNAEQLCWINPKYINTPIYKDIYVFDINSSFPNGIMMLPKEFTPLQEYTLQVYNKREMEQDLLKRKQYKNMLNMLVGYFERINSLVPLRHKIIDNSNKYILTYKYLIENNGGTVYLINVDSIITDKIGADIMNNFIGTGLGQFKIEMVSDRLIYKSNLIYQVGNRIRYSGKKELERENIDLFKGEDAYQLTKFVNGKDYNVFTDNKELSMLCTYYTQPAEIIIKNKLGEIIKHKTYFTEV